MKKLLAFVLTLALAACSATPAESMPLPIIHTEEVQVEIDYRKLGNWEVTIGAPLCTPEVTVVQQDVPISLDIENGWLVSGADETLLNLGFLTACKLHDQGFVQLDIRNETIAMMYSFVAKAQERTYEEYATYVATWGTPISEDGYKAILVPAELPLKLVREVLPAP